MVRARWFLMQMAGLVLLGGAAHADTVIQGAVRQISTDDAAAIGSTLGCRAYQVTGPVSTINANTPECIDQRCIRTFSTNALFGGPGFGGYNCNQESSGAYGPPPAEPSDQVFYNLIDANVNAGTCNHIGFYAVQGQSANNNTDNNPGDARRAACAGTVTQNCFTAADLSNSDPTPLTGTWVTYGSVPHQIRSAGGLSPVPVVRWGYPGGGGCAPDQLRVTWDDPISADPTMKNGVPSPVLGVNLYRWDVPQCGGSGSPCPTDAGPWVRVSTPLAPNGEYGPNSGAAGDCVIATLYPYPPYQGSTTHFALTIRMKGSGPGSSTLETYIGSNSVPFYRCPTPSRIVTFSARYAGRGAVDVRWTSGVEGGVDGYYVTRATSPAGPFKRVSDLVSVSGDGSGYRFSDRIRTSMGRTLVYRIEIVNSDGSSELSGTESVMVPGPKMKKFGGP